MGHRVIEYKWPDGKVRYIPQWSDGEGWHEYFRYDDGSPYLHVAIFAARDEAVKHFQTPGIFGTQMPGCEARVVYITTSEYEDAMRKAQLEVEKQKWHEDQRYNDAVEAEARRLEDQPSERP